MKYFILLFFLCISSGVVSQNYTEKYNDLQQRYEYFGSDGRMVGYKKYNSLSEQWEYTDLTSSNNNQSGRYIVHDYGKPQSNFNMELALQQVKAHNQASYNKAIQGLEKQKQGNIRKMESKYNELYSELGKYQEEYKRTKAQQDFSNYTKDLLDLNRDINFASIPLTDGIVNKMIKRYNEIIQEIKNLKPLEDKEWFGGYTAETIEEYELDEVSKEYKLVNIINKEAKLYFSDEIYYFKRGDSSVWLRNQWSKMDNTVENIYGFFDDHGNFVYVDFNFNKVVFFGERNNDSGLFKKRYFYTSLKKNDQVRPQ